jgi:ABC-type dipeptide/oligopeptide/nickel transport system permease component
MYGVITVIFFLFQIKPGDPARMLGGNNATEDILRAIRSDLGLDLPVYKQYFLYLNDLSPISMHKENRLDSNSHIYLDSTKYTYVKLFSTGDHAVVMKLPYFRRSYRFNEKVSTIISESLPGTIILAFSSIVLASILGIIMGVIAAVNKGGFFDNFCSVIAILGISGPSYFIGLIIAWIGGYIWFKTTSIPMMPIAFFGIGLLVGISFNKFSRKQILGKFSYSFMFECAFKGLAYGFVVWLVGFMINGMAGYEALPLIGNFIDLPGTGLNMAGPLVEPIYTDDGDYMEVYQWKNLILPTIALGIRPLAIVLQLTRSSMLEVMSQDYIRTAKAKGLSNFKVLVGHALKNALNPVVTALSGWFASLLAGAVFIEEVFAWNGIGKEVFDAVFYDDLPLVIGSVLVISSMFVFLNIIVDIVYGLLDPRIRLKA